MHKLVHGNAIDYSEGFPCCLVYIKDKAELG